MDANQLKLIVVSYYQNSDLEVLISNAMHVVDYGYPTEIDVHTFVSLATQDQFVSLYRHGFKPETLDPEADLGRYVYLYSEAPNRASILSEFGQVFAVTPNYAILKTAEGVSFDPEKAAGFEVRQLLYEERESQEITIVPTKQPFVSTTPPAYQKLDSGIIMALVLVGLLIAGLAGVILWKYRSSGQQI